MENLQESRPEALTAASPAPTQAGPEGNTAEDAAPGKRRFRRREKSPRIPTSKIRLNYYTLFWVFFIGCFIGVVLETVWCLLTRHHYENRVGLVYGPFNPVYGLGAVLMTVCLKWLSDKRDLWIFLGSAVIGGAFEYLCSLFQELSFGTVSWEYSKTQFNFDGRTNVMYAFMWGLLGLLWVKELFPRLYALIKKSPRKPGIVLTGVLTVFMVLNMLVSAMALERQSQRREGVPATNPVSQFFDRHFPDERLQRIYPNMMVVEDLPL